MRLTIIKKIGGLLMLIGMITNGLTAQTLADPDDVQISLSATTEQVVSDTIMDTLTDPFYLLMTETQLKVGVSFKLPDNTTISKINVTLGTASGTSDLVQHSFTYGDTNPGGSFSYEEGNSFIKLGLGNHNNSNNALYYVSVELEDSSGNKSSIIQSDSSL